MKVPLTLLQPFPLPTTAQLPMITPLLRVLLLVLIVPATEVLVRVRVFPPEVMTNENVPVTWSAALNVTIKFPVGVSPVTGKHPPSIWVKN